MIIEINIDNKPSMNVSVSDDIVDGNEMYHRLLLDPDVVKGIGDRVIIKHVYVPGDVNLKRIGMLNITTMDKDDDSDKAWTMPKYGRVPERDIADGCSQEKMLEISEYNFKHCTTYYSHELAPLIDCLKMSNMPFEFYSSHSNEVICLPCVPDNEEQASIMLVFDKSGQFVDLLINNKSIKPKHRNRRHNLPENIHEKIMAKCVKTIYAYIKAYSSKNSKKTISNEERSTLKAIVKNRNGLVGKMGLRSFVKFVGDLTFDLSCTLSYMDRHDLE